MIGEAVAEFKGQKIESPAELKLELPVDAHIPTLYVDSERLRLEAYHKLSAASGETATREQLSAILAELEDRYGTPPQPVLNLIEVTALRQQANRLGIKELTMLGSQVKITPVALTDAEQVLLSHRLPGSRYMQTSKLLTLPVPKNAAGEPMRDQEVIDYTWALLAKVFVASGSETHSA
jgi:transcription-repair coupling factor (superfamily II helicase)